jgi:uncharacterized membrane protein YcaP (DUF421 family)
LEKEDIHLDDIKRILIGNAPPEFLLEVLLRSVCVYLVVLIVVRLLGKRMSGQVTITEMAVFIMLGAIIGSPMQIPDRGIVMGIVILLCTLLFVRLVNRLNCKNENLEKVTQGQVKMLVKNGVLQLDRMAEDRISPAQLFARLREQEIYQLGEVKRVYLEASGTFSIYKNEKSTAGLAVFPPDDQEVLQQFEHGVGGLKACKHCGKVSAAETKVCPVCHKNEFTAAVQQRV